MSDRLSPEQRAERNAAEFAYSIAAFNYQEAPIGSRDWCLFWKGWQERARFTRAGEMPEPSTTGRSTAPADAPL